MPVLAWRLGADVAAELGLPAGRARTLALGVGLTAAVELPARPVQRPARFDRRSSPPWSWAPAS